MRVISMFFGLLLISLQAMADGKIAGKVSDEKTGDPIIGATVVVKGSANGTSTDVDGRFLLNVPAGEYVVEFKYIGYQQKNISDVTVADGKVTDVNVVITEDTKTTLKEVVVTGSLKKESINALYTLQKNSISVSSGISADIIQRTPDRNTGEVLKRVSGASVRDGKYVVIRGLSDRYNMAMVNNALMPSTEPDKKAFSFDIIPSNLIDNIIINKTASPDLPGDFAGGVVTVLTKDVPEQNFLNVGASVGYNTQATFKDAETHGRNLGSYFGFPGSKGELPASFGASRKDYLAMSHEQRATAASALSSNYETTKGKVLPNTSLQLSMGNVQRLKNGGKFGTILSVTQRSGVNINPEFVRGVYDIDQINRSGIDNYNKFSSNLAGLANFSYVQGKSKISLKNLYNKILDNVYYDRKGFSTSNLFEYKTTSTVPSERQMLNTQLEGDHAIGEKNVKIYWNLNYSNLTAAQNDIRTAFYSRGISLDANMNPVSDETLPYTIVDRNSRHFFSDQKDNSYGGNFHISYPFEMFGQKQTIKAGYLGLYKTRSFSARAFQYEPYDVAPGTDVSTLPAAEIFSSAHMGPGGYSLSEITNPTDAYTASGMLHSGFAMLDNTFGEKWRLSWGVRVESYEQNLKATGMSNETIDQTDVFTDILPSFNLSYNASEKTKWRLSGSRTVNRPEFRELAPFQFIDFENLWTLIGRPGLNRSNITNVDLRYEFYPNPGETITLGAFYKHFENPIEAVMDAASTAELMQFTYQNAKAADAIGVEFDFRKKLSFLGDQKWLENITVAGNFTYIYSKVNTEGLVGTVYTPGTKADRPLQGQSPYLINLSALYTDPKHGWSFSALYNRIGNRINIVGNAYIPTTWERGRDVIDLQISKAILKQKGEIKLTVSDLLNQTTIWYWNNDTKDGYSGSSNPRDISGDRRFQSYRMGTTFTLGFNYRIGK